MSEELKELMQISVINEDKELSTIVNDIVPLKEQRFTDLELEADKNESFSLVIYKKQNPFSKILSKIRFSLEKMKIIKTSRQFDLAQNDSWNNGL